jgi:hypothetical protein
MRAVRFERPICVKVRCLLIQRTAHTMPAQLACPACGYLTVKDAWYGSYEICGVCDWEDDALQLANAATGGGANDESLAAVQQRLVAHPPNNAAAAATAQDASWRPLTGSEVAAAERDAAENAFKHKGGGGDPAAAYWNL